MGHKKLLDGVFKLTLILGLLFFQKALALRPTIHIELPAPFSYVENLYFDARSDFIVLGPNVIPEKIIQPHLNRGYQLVHLPLNRRKLLHEYSHLKKKRIHFLEGITLLLMEYPTKNYLFHFFHLIEHLVGIWSFYGGDYSQEVKRIILAADGIDQRQNWEGPNHINQHLLRALFPHAEVKTWRDFRKECGRKFICLERALTSDRAVATFLPECTKINKHLGAALPFISSKSLEVLADTVQAYARTAREKNCAHLRITYLKRSPPRCLTVNVEEALIKRISAIPNGRLRVEDFAQLSFQEQINIIGTTDVLISVHGNGLSHLLFLPLNACVMEIFPPDNHHLDYHLLADARGIEYYGVLYRDKAFLNRNQAYQIGAYGSPNSAIDELDIDLIVSEISARAALAMQRNL